MSNIWFLEPGIDSWPGNQYDWTDRAETWLHVNRKHYVKKMEYFANPFTRRMHQDERAAALADYCLNQYVANGWITHTICHSNGCDIVRRAIVDHGAEFDTVHMVAAATDNDFATNGLATALLDGRIKKLFIYMGGQDRVLGILARLSKWLLSWVGLGYGTLGIDGPTNMGDAASKVEIILNAEFGHSTMWEPSNFDGEMRLIFHKYQLCLEG